MQLHARVDAELREDRAQVVLDGAWADKQPRRRSRPKSPSSHARACPTPGAASSTSWPPGRSCRMTLPNALRCPGVVSHLTDAER
jgi:hypothetical protein